MIANAYLDEDRNLVLEPKHYFVQSIDNNGTLDNPFADSLQMSAMLTGEKLTLDFSPFGDKVILRSSNGRECPFLIRPVEDKATATLSYDSCLKTPEIYFRDGKKSLEEEFKYFKPFERLGRHELSLTLHMVLEPIEIYAKNHKLLAVLPNAHEQAEYLVAMQDFAYGKAYSWQAFCQQKQRELRLKEHAPKLLFQSNSFMVNSTSQEACVRLYELAEDDKYLTTMQSLRGGVETSYIEKVIDGSYSRACGTFDSACSRMGTKPENLTHEERQARKEACQKEADHRFALIQEAKAISENERGGKEKFLALLAEGFDKDPLYYGEYAARKAAGMGWQDKEIKTALRLYAPDAALDAVSKSMTFAEDMVSHKDRSSFNFASTTSTRGNVR